MGSALVLDAIVLSTIRYGETSKVVRLATRELGVQSALAKGASRPRSRFGAALQLLSEGQAGVHLSRTGDLHTLTAFDVVRVREALAHRMDRYVTATTMAELMLRFAPPAPVSGAYDLLRDALALLEVAPAAAVDTLALRMVWRLVTLLGYAPCLSQCARDGAPVPEGAPAIFGFSDGGILCPRCAVGNQGPRLGPDHRSALADLLDPAAELPVLNPLHEAAHRRLFSRWVRWQLGGEVKTPALDLFLERPWEPDP